jgi:hypothetical protein
MDTQQRRARRWLPTSIADHAPGFLSLSSNQVEALHGLLESPLTGRQLLSCINELTWRATHNNRESERLLPLAKEALDRLLTFGVINPTKEQVENARFIRD